MHRHSSSRWLCYKARIWRFLMSIGMFIHKRWSKRPMSPSFTRWIASTLSDAPGRINLSIYVPRGYDSQRRKDFRPVRGGKGYPVLVNLHGGGFTLGASTDDARFITAAVKQLECVVISVDYRLAPEFPFPTAVDDTADTVLWLARHATELGVDAQNIAIAGFSSGGNLSLTVPVRLHDHIHGIKRNLFSSISNSLPTSTTSLLKEPVTRTRQLDPTASSLSLAPTLTSDAASETLAMQAPLSTRVPPPTDVPPFAIKAIIPFYAPTNYALSRAERKATNPSPLHNLSPALTALFDESYLPAEAGVRAANPYLSPGLMSSQDLRDAYADIPVWAVGCELDMVTAELADFVMRLRAARAGHECGEGDIMKDAATEDDQGVGFAIVKGVPHAWDKKPFMSGKDITSSQKEYDYVCGKLIEVFE